MNGGRTTTAPLSFLQKSGPSWPPPSPPITAPTSPSTSNNTRASMRKSGSTDPGWNRTLDTRDELIVSLMASEAVIDSRQFSILAAEEVDELKKEYQVLSVRVEAMGKKLARETKIRDAAVSLSRVNASHKTVSRQTGEQLEAATVRVEATQWDLSQVSARAAEVHRRLMEHRAAVLSFSVRTLEKKVSNDDSGYDSSSLSPPLSASATPRFDGAHLFAGHADAIIPRRQLSAEAAAAELTALEGKLRGAQVALADAAKKHADVLRELSVLQLEKQEVETLMGMDLQAAEESVATLELELAASREAHGRWEEERGALRGQIDSAHTAQRDTEKQDDLRRELAGKDAEISSLKAALEDLRAEAARAEDDKMEDLSRLHEELEGAREEAQAEISKGRNALQTLVSSHGIVLFTRDTSMAGLVGAIGTHLEAVHGKLEAHVRAEAEWDTSKRRLEDDVRAGFDRREALARELEDARKERDSARRETADARLSLQALPTPLPSQGHLRSMSSVPTASTHAGAEGEAARIVSVLQPLWAILPSPEARAVKHGAGATRSFRAGSPTSVSPAPSSPGGAATPGVVSSLSDLDVRSLKTLYSAKDVTSPRTANNIPFSIEAFATRVQALIADDKALIERLLRFAQAHDLLKKNAERAQKLAQDGTLALETYQKQVRVLEERNSAAVARSGVMQDELDLLHDTIERMTNEKRDLERLAAEQAAECQALAAANDTLSARTLTLAEEAAQAPERVRQKLEAQLAEVRKELVKVRKALELAQDEVDAMRTSEQSQRIALLDELNSMQTENGVLRAQLRAAKK